MRGRLQCCGWMGCDGMVIIGHRSSKSINDITYIWFYFKVLIPTIIGNREPAVEEKSPNQWMFRHSLCFPPGRTPIVIIIMNIILAFIYCHNLPCDNHHHHHHPCVDPLHHAPCQLYYHTSVPQIKDEPQKMTLTSETEFILRVGPQWWFWWYAPLTKFEIP